jgi:Uma2 family endonuclease
MATQPVPLVTPEVYLELERRAEFRSEYINGDMFAMSGGTWNHARIVRNTMSRLDEQLAGSSCEPVSSDIRLHSAMFDYCTYPDIVVVCGETKFPESRKDTITDATLVVEVLSPSTKELRPWRQVRLLPFSPFLLRIPPPVSGPDPR